MNSKWGSIEIFRKIVNLIQNIYASNLSILMTKTHNFECDCRFRIFKENHVVHASIDEIRNNPQI